jgi:signal transduction histidine kinase
VQFMNMLHVWQKNALTVETTPSEGTTTTVPVAFSWYSILPFAIIPAVIALGFYVWRAGEMGPLAQGVYLGGAILVGLVVLRQFLVFRKMIYYTKQLSMTQQELNLKNQALSEANSRLEEQATQLETAYEQQLHLNELKDQFLLNVNHELRTPLTELHGYLNLLTEYKGQLDQEMQATFVNHALHGSEELLQLVSNVLDAIRGDVHKKATLLEDLPISLMVDEAIAVFDPQKREEYSLDLNIPETLIVRADRHYLHQILLNLLSNAFKYCPPGTSISISAALPETANDGNGQNAARAAEVCICVQDTGPGIPSSEIPLLFGKFVRLNRDLVGSVRGTGLGLYITKQLVEGMEGRIWVESTGIAGEGSRFYFTLPRVLRAAQVEIVESHVSTSVNA